MISSQLPHFLPNIQPLARQTSPMSPNNHKVAEALSPLPQLYLSAVASHQAWHSSWE